MLRGAGRGERGTGSIAAAEQDECKFCMNSPPLPPSFRKQGKYQKKREKLGECDLLSKSFFRLHNDFQKLREVGSQKVTHNNGLPAAASEPSSGVFTSLPFTPLPSNLDEDKKCNFHIVAVPDSYPQGTHGLRVMFLF